MDRDEMFEIMCDLIEAMRDIKAQDLLFAHENTLLLHLERVLDNETANLEIELAATD